MTCLPAVQTLSHRICRQVSLQLQEKTYLNFSVAGILHLSATLSEDGSPHVTPVWADMEGDLILINTSEASAKTRHVSKDPRVGISLVDQFNPYNMVTIKGRVVEMTSEGADEHLHKLAKRYLGIGKYYYRKPKDKRVIIKVKPDKVMGLSGHPAFYFLGYLPRDEK